MKVSKWASICEQSIRSSAPFETIKVTIPEPKVALITLNRPKCYNALSVKMLSEILEAGTIIDDTKEIACVVLTGSEKSFAAGADILELRNSQVSDLNKNLWGCISRIQKPVIAAVNGIAFGGGCELVMSSDVIYAGKSSTFAQPEIKLGIIPGGGATQRLIRSIGKSRAMEMILTGNTISAHEAQSWGLVSKVFDNDKVLPEAIKTAVKMSSYSKSALIKAKEAMLQSFESNLSKGLDKEWELFLSLFTTRDKLEGLNAFLEKRKPKFKD